MQRLIVTCRLHDIDPYDYLVDVLQRGAIHSASAGPLFAIDAQSPTVC